jgi:hypothetical protein
VEIIILEQPWEKRRRPLYIVLIAAVLLIIIGLFFFMGNDHLKTETAAPAEVQGTYTVLLHGCRHSDDLENIDILTGKGTLTHIRSLLRILLTQSRPELRVSRR